jgi:aspartyl-tRNA(Asn)/glutamyl-tRNA(Gln) amidotransferase subunit A
MSADLCLQTVTELAPQLRSGKVSPVALAEAYLERLEQIGPRFNAVASVMKDRALKEAHAATKEIKTKYRGPLHGMPYGAKDLLAAAGAPTTWGAKPYEHQAFDFDATAIQRLQRAGAVLLGKLAMVELAGGLGYNEAKSSLQGPGRTPWNPDHWSGGSSSGTGASVAAGLVGFGIGSETWGSILCPSSFCGVSGLRPTYGRISRHGAMALSWTLDKLGPMARSIADCRLVLDALHGADPLDPSARSEPLVWRDAKQGLKGLRAGLLPFDWSKAGEKEVEANYRAAVKELEAAGLHVQEVKPPDIPVEQVAGTLIQCEAAASFEELFRDGRVRQLTYAKAPKAEALAREIGAPDLLKAYRLRTDFQRQVNRLFDEVDVLLFPGFTTTAPRVDSNLDDLPTGPDWIGGAGNLCGLPAACVPTGLGQKHLPTSLQVVAAPFEEPLAVLVAEVFQRRTDWHRQRPPL